MELNMRVLGYKTVKMELELKHKKMELKKKLNIVWETE